MARRSIQHHNASVCMAVAGLSMMLSLCACESAPSKSSAPTPSAEEAAQETETRAAQSVGANQTEAHVHDVAPPADETAAEPTAETPEPPDGPQPPRYADVDWPHIRIDLNNRVVELDGFSGINEGWLEQIICLAGTRTHESVLITEAKPSHIHAALLLIGLEPGHPGWWRIDPDDPKGERWIMEQPTGSPVSIAVHWTDKQGQPREAPIREWVRDYHTHALLPEGPWIFGGSLMKPDYTGKVVYVADHSGSIAGLVTFGDELLGWSEVLPDQEAVMAPEWEANTPAMPEPLTPVKIRLRPAAPN